MQILLAAAVSLLFTGAHTAMSFFDRFNPAAAPAKTPAKTLDCPDWKTFSAMHPQLFAKTAHVTAGLSDLLPKGGRTSATLTDAAGVRYSVVIYDGIDPIRAQMANENEMLKYISSKRDLPVIGYLGCMRVPYNSKLPSRYMFFYEYTSDNMFDRIETLKAMPFSELLDLYSAIIRRYTELDHSNIIHNAVSPFSIRFKNEDFPKPYLINFGFSFKKDQPPIQHPLQISQPLLQTPSNKGPSEISNVAHLLFRVQACRLTPGCSAHRFYNEMRKLNGMEAISTHKLESILRSLQSNDNSELSIAQVLYNYSTQAKRNPTYASYTTMQKDIDTLRSAIYSVGEAGRFPHFTSELRMPAKDSPRFPRREGPATPATPRKEEPARHHREEPSPRYREEPARRHREEPSPIYREEPARRHREEPSPIYREEPARRHREEPSPRHREVPPPIPQRSDLLPGSDKVPPRRRDASDEHLRRRRGSNSESSADDYSFSKDAKH